MEWTIPEGCGRPFHLSYRNRGGPSIFCNGCKCDVPTEGVGYWSCAHCGKWCMSCAALKQQANAMPSLSNKDRPLEQKPAAQASSDRRRPLRSANAIPSSPESPQEENTGSCDGDKRGCDVPRQASTVGAIQSSRSCNLHQVSSNGDPKRDGAEEKKKVTTAKSADSISWTINGRCGILSHSPHWCMGGESIFCNDCTDWVHTIPGLGYYFCSECDIKYCMPCARLRKGHQERSDPGQKSGSRDSETRGQDVPRQAGTDGNPDKDGDKERKKNKMQSGDSIPWTIPKLCGVLSHSPHWCMGGEGIFCNDCAHWVPTIAGVGYYFCSQCRINFCMPCARFRQGNQEGNTPQEKKPVTPAVKANYVDAAQSSRLKYDSQEDDDDEKKPVIACAMSSRHTLEFLQEPPYQEPSYCEGFGCNLCGKACCSELYYCEACRFSAHKECAEIGKELKVFFHGHALRREDSGEEGMVCSFCYGEEDAVASRWMYRCPCCPSYSAHPRCAKYSKWLKHVAHQHTLTLVENPSKDKSQTCLCDGCNREIRQGYRYRCPEWGCDFDLHPLCAILPSEPLCPVSATHRLHLEYQAIDSDQCVLCGKWPFLPWVYRCTECSESAVSMHVECVIGAGSDDDELNDEEDQVLRPLYQQFMDSMVDFEKQGNTETVDKLSRLVHSFKIDTETAAHSLRRHSSVRSRVYPKLSTPARSETYVVFGKPSLSDSPGEEIRRTDEQVLKEERRGEKTAATALQKQASSRRLEKVMSKLQNVETAIETTRNSKSSGRSISAAAELFAMLKALIEREARLNEERHREITKLHHEKESRDRERHLENNRGIHEIIRTQVQSTTHSVPRLVLCTETSSYMKKLVTTLRVGLKGVQLHLFCEHAHRPHFVEDAPGCEIHQKVAGDRWDTLQPFLSSGLKVFAAAISVAGVAVGFGGLKDVLPDLHKLVSNTQAYDLGKNIVQSRGSRDKEPQEVVAQWLSSYLYSQKINIADTFKLYRVRYKSPKDIQGSIGWLCLDHLKHGKADGSLEPFPVPW